CPDRISWSSSISGPCDNREDRKGIAISGRLGAHPRRSSPSRTSKDWYWPSKMRRRSPTLPPGCHPYHRSACKRSFDMECSDTSARQRVVGFRVIRLCDETVHARIVRRTLLESG